MNYTELKQEVADFSHRDDLTSKMDIFCQLAEGIINKDLRVLEMEYIAFDLLTGGSLSRPGDYLEMVHIADTTSGDFCNLESLPINQLTGTYDTLRGTPRYFAILQEFISIRPKGSTTDPRTIQYTYIRRVPSLISNSTNAILDNYPMIYLAAMMVQVSIYLQDDEQLKIWVDAFGSQVSAANKQYQRSKNLRPRVRIA